MKKTGIRQQARAVLAATTLLAALAGATVFLCARPSKATVPGNERHATARQTAIQAAMQSGELVVLADRHARDAAHIAAQVADGAGSDDLGWDYVQLRL